MALGAVPLPSQQADGRVAVAARKAASCSAGKGLRAGGRARSFGVGLLSCDSRSLPE